MMNVLIAVPLKPEIKLIKNLIDKNTACSIDFIQAGHGKVNFAINLMKHLCESKKNYSLVICAGSAGALSEDLKIGDVVVSTKIIEHDFKSTFLNHEKPFYSTDQSFLKIISDLQFEKFKLVQAIIASGDEDITSVHRAHEIKKETQASAVAWEGIGGAKTCTTLNLAYVEIRAITDKANENTIEEFKENLVPAMKNLVDVLNKFLKNLN